MTDPKPEDKPEDKPATTPPPTDPAPVAAASQSEPPKKRKAGAVEDSAAIAPTFPAQFGGDPFIEMPVQMRHEEETAG